MLGLGPVGPLQEQPVPLTTEPPLQPVFESGFHVAQAGLGTGMYLRMILSFPSARIVVTTTRLTQTFWSALQALELEQFIFSILLCSLPPSSRV